MLSRFRAFRLANLKGIAVAVMSVDDVVAAVIAEVDKLGLTDSTYFFCKKMVTLFSTCRAARLANAASITIADSSDHGFQLGQFNSAPHLQNPTPKPVFALPS